MTDLATLSARCVRNSSRQIDALITALMLPVLMMVLFVELFGGAIRIEGRYVSYVVPGVLLLCVGFGSGLTAVSVAHDAAGGFFDRLRSMSVGGVAVLGGHVAASLVRNAASSALVIAVAFGLGFRSHADALRWLAAIGLLAAFVLAVSWLAAALGLVAGSPEAANGFTFVLMFVPYASSAFVPVGTMPGWLQGFAAHQPITPLAEALRALLLGGRVGTDLWSALGWCGGIAGFAVIASAVLYRRAG